MNWGNIISAAGSIAGMGGEKEEKEQEIKPAPKTKLSRLNGVISDLTNVYKNDSAGSQEASQAGDAVAGAFDNMGKLVENIREKRAANASKPE